MLMPKIDLELLKEQLTPAELEIVSKIVASRGKNKGRLRASKPKVDFVEKDGELVPSDLAAGKAAYVWRMVAHYTSPLRQHHCMPCTAEFSLPGSYYERRSLIEELGRLVDIVCKTIPVEQWHGVRRWAGILGRVT